jgi:hypothetical protein
MTSQRQEEDSRTDISERHHDATDGVDSCYKQLLLIDRVGKKSQRTFSTRTLPTYRVSYATMRQLSLHASALNDAEYELYTSSLQDLAWAGDQDSSFASTSGQNDAYYEQMRVGVREVRAWFRGRYGHVAPASIDGVSSQYLVHLTDHVQSSNLLFQILRYFSQGMGQFETISGGQFFAALRLVVHVESGRDVDRGLAFVQGMNHTEL